MDGNQLDNCSSLLVAKPCNSGSTDDDLADCERRAFPSSSGAAEKCAHSGFDPAAERPHLRQFIDVIKERNSRMPHPLLTETLSSGYGGFVPNQPAQVGKTFTESVIRAVGQLEPGGRERKDVEPSSDYARRTASASGQSEDSKRGLLKELVAQRYNEEKQRKGFVSPYHMANDDPLKSYIPGYMGYVPKTMNKFGTYSGMTHEGLNEFTDSLQKHRKSEPDSFCT